MAPQSGTDHPTSVDRVLDSAERLFAEHGYSAVKLRHIAGELGVTTASLYYHFPKGKRELFVSVMERSMHRHRVGLESAIAQAGDDWRTQLEGAASWFLNQPRVDIFRMMETDIKEIDENHVGRFTQLIYESVMEPIVEVFEKLLDRHRAAGSDTELPDSRLLAGSFLAIMQGIHFVPEHFRAPDKQRMARQMITVFADGLALP